MATGRELREESQRTLLDKSYVGGLVDKWGDLLEGLPTRSDHDRYVVGMTAMLMENQKEYLKNMQEDVRTQNVGSFTKFIYPILRRVFPNLIANEIVSVQPMTAPVGAVFYLEYIYNTAKGETKKGDIFPKNFNSEYSSEKISGEILATGNGAAFGGVGTVLAANLSFTPVRPLNTNRGVSVTIRELDSTGATVQEATDDGSGGFTGDVTGTPSINYDNGALTGFLFTNAPANGNQIKVYYWYNGELNSQIPQVTLDVKKAPVEAISRRLKALWSSEAAEDLRVFHGLDAETEIIAAVAQEIALEIDREVISDIFSASTSNTASFDRVPPSGISELEHLRSMITTIATLSNRIHTRTLRAPGNFIITSPEISALLAQLSTHGDYRPLWTADGDSFGQMVLPRPMTQHGQFGIYKTGTLMNKWIIYEDPFFTRDRLMVGLKGSGYLDAGYVWAPYVPLQVTPSFLDPNDFSFRKGMRTRYAKKLLRNDFYASMRVLNL